MVGARPSPSKLLLVEGEDDEHVIEHLRKRLCPILEFDTKSTGGVPKLFSQVNPEIKVSGRIALGIVVDADDDLTCCWATMVDSFSNGNISLPANPEPGGTIVLGTPRIGIWLMPNNESSGELEDFVRTMIPMRDPVWDSSEDYIDGIPGEHRKFSDGKNLKAKLYAWLATRRAPGRMGAAIRAGDLCTDGELSSKFADWLQRLFT